MPCQRIFVLFDSGVPKTFVGDCICVTTRDYDMLRGKIGKRPRVMFEFVMALPLAVQINVLGSLIFSVL